MVKTTAYGESGVDYNLIDEFKIAAQRESGITAQNLAYFDIQEIEESRGESAYLVYHSQTGVYFAHTNEGLGTKNLVADEMYKIKRCPDYYAKIAYDAVAMIVNDLITVGALPFQVSMNLAVSDSSWFKDKIRWLALIRGWKEACDASKCSWGCGETSVLKNVKRGSFVISGAGNGLIKDQKNILLGSKIKNGDAIIIIESSGIHANGLTLARKIAERRDNVLKRIGNFLFPNTVKLNQLTNGYFTIMDDGRFFGEVLLDRAIIYAPVIRECFNRDVVLHYVVNITGHGWRKFMRANQKFNYVIEKIPRIQGTIFEFLLEQLQRQNNLDSREVLKEAYAIFNMGAGFAIYAPEKEVVKIIQIAESLKMKAFYAGYIEKSEKEKNVVIKPLNIIFREQDLKIRCY